MAVDKNVPQDIDEESQAEQLVIDCSVVSETVKQTVVKPVQKERFFFSRVYYVRLAVSATGFFLIMGMFYISFKN